MSAQDRGINGGHFVAGQFAATHCRQLSGKSSAGFGVRGFGYDDGRFNQRLMRTDAGDIAGPRLVRPRTNESERRIHADANYEQYHCGPREPAVPAGGPQFALDVVEHGAAQVGGCAGALRCGQLLFEIRRAILGP